MAQGNLQVATREGRISGASENGILVFKGIPFAKPPIGARRWRPPEPAEAWTGLRPAQDFAPACMQLPNPGMNLPEQPVSEDCLYLNIWTPALKRAQLPVIVWIHGGAFSYGSTAMPIFSGASLARKGVVFVSIPYRLGPIGFLAHPALSAESSDHVSGNYGLLDQIAGLRWVAANIRRFGGDPKRVTIMGESAGAMSVGLLAQASPSPGLFSGVIAESGSGFSIPDGLLTTLAMAEASGKGWADKLGVTTADGLRSLSAEEILKSTPPNPALRFALANSWPVRDGWLLPRDAEAAYRRHEFVDTPILIGSNADEGSLFWPTPTLTAYRQKLRQRFGNLAGSIFTVYPAVSDSEARNADSALIGDTIFLLPQLKWARAQSQFGRGQVYFYHFAQNPPPRPGSSVGPVHGSELPYALANQATRNLAWTPSDRALSDLMSTYWVNFAKRGNPNGSGLPRWDAFSKRGNVAWFRDGSMVPGGIANQQRLDALSGFVPQLEMLPRRYNAATSEAIGCQRLRDPKGKRSARPPCLASL